MGVTGPADLRTHRPPWAPVVAVAWFLVAGALFVDLLRRGDGSQIASGVLVLASSVIVAYVFGLQPCVEEFPDGLFVKNPLRRVRVRWSDLRDVVPRDVLVLVTESGTIRCGGVVGRGRTAEAGRQATKLMYPSARGADLAESPADRGSDPSSVAARIVVRWEAAGGFDADRSTDPQLRWHPPSLGLVGAAALMLVAAAAI
jgi:hypothetical protein